MTPTFTTYLVGPLVEAFYSRYPNITLNVHELAQEHMDRARNLYYAPISRATTAARSVYHAGNRLRNGKQPIWKRQCRRACYRNMKNINQAARVIKTGEPRLHTSTFDRLRPFATGCFRPKAFIHTRLANGAFRTTY